MSKRITITVKMNATNREQGKIFDLLVAFGKKPSYARMIVYEAGVYYAINSEDLVAFKAALRIGSLQHVVRLGS
ncbi:MAG: hypothetical protein JRC86_05945 [Deltaproteobacteria bacterium]|nr:hypothetical protein [Deltaproteobacteria bacterium]